MACGNLLVDRGDGKVFFGQGGTKGEEFVAAGVAAERGESQKAAEEGEDAGDVFGSDFLEFGVAAVAAVGVKGKAEGHGARVKALFAEFAAPGKNVGGAEEIVRQRAPLGAANFDGVTAWTGNGQGVGIALSGPA
jgi:hypothetical protein